MKKMTVLSTLLDFLFPRYCTVCGKRLEWDEDVICLLCNAMLPRTEYWTTPYDNPVAQLFWGKIPIEKAIAFCHFKSQTDDAQIIYDMKYHNRQDVAKQMGEMIATEVGESGFFDDIDCIVPVPLSLKRRMKRGYNQCELLAEGISNVTGLPVLPYVVVRKRFDSSQTHLTQWERERNVENVFELKDAEEIKGKHVLLVDDVITTGATTLSCARQLLQAEEARISILSIGFAGRK